jgi:hypothetical protein
MRSLEVLAREAIDVQNACNLLGVSKGFARAIQDLREALDASGLPSGTDDINRHPIARLWASKVHDMTGMGISDGMRFDEAYSACDLLAYTKADQVADKKLLGELGVETS